MVDHIEGKDLVPSIVIPEVEDTPEPDNDSVIAGDSLCPDLTPTPAQKQYWYWLGLRPECPTDQLSVGGIGLLKRSEVVVRDGHKQVRVPKRGAIMRLSMDQLERFRDRLSRTILRPLRPRESSETWLHSTILIPNEEERQRYFRARGRHLKPFRPQVGDIALASLCYAKLLNSRDASPMSWDALVPEPLSVTGLELPSENTVAAAPQKPRF